MVHLRMYLKYIYVVTLRLVNQDFGTSIGDLKATDIPEFLHELAKITEGDFFEFATNNTDKVLEVASKYKL